MKYAVAKTYDLTTLGWTDQEATGDALHLWAHLENWLATRVSHEYTPHVCTIQVVPVSAQVFEVIGTVVGHTEEQATYAFDQVAESAFNLHSECEADTLKNCPVYPGSRAQGVAEMMDSGPVAILDKVLSEIEQIIAPKGN